MQPGAAGKKRKGVDKEVEPLYDLARNFAQILWGDRCSSDPKGVAKQSVSLATSVIYSIKESL